MGKLDELLKEETKFVGRELTLLSSSLSQVGGHEVWFFTYEVVLGDSTYTRWAVYVDGKGGGGGGVGHRLAH